MKRWFYLSLVGRGLFALSGVLASAPSFSAGDDWLYRVRPDDTIWDLTGHYLKPGFPWQKLQDYNHVADPLHLPPGSTIRVPVAWLRVQPANATVVAVKGTAFAHPGGQDASVPVHAGMVLGYGTQLTTDADTSLTLEFADGSRLLMQSHGELWLDKLSAYSDTGMVDTRLRLQRGRATSDVTPLKGAAAHFSVTTPGLVASVQGTHFRVVADPETQSAQAGVTRGKVEVTGNRHRVLLKTGTGIAVADGAAPGMSRALLEAPALPCPDEPIRQTTYRLAWPALDGARRYAVEMASTETFETLLVDRVVDEPQALLDGLPDGKHAIRVRGIDADRIEGMDAACVIAVDAHPQPPLVMAPLAKAKVHGDRPHFRWTESDGVSSYTWQVASDSSFSQPLVDQRDVRGSDVRSPEALPLGRYFWRVASRDAQGKLGPYTDAIPFDLVKDSPVPAVDGIKHSHGGLSLAWQDTVPGLHYQVQFSSDKAFAHVLVDEVVDRPAIQIDHAGSGTRYLRVRVVEEDGYEGAWSAVQKVHMPCVACRVAVGAGTVVLLLLL